MDGSFLFPKKKIEETNKALLIRINRILTFINNGGQTLNVTFNLLETMQVIRQQKSNEIRTIIRG